MDESLEGQLVKIVGANFNAGCANFVSSTYTFSAQSESGVIYLRSGHALIGSLIPTVPVDIVGIASQFSFTGVGGYQLLPRDGADMGGAAGLQLSLIHI